MTTRSRISLALLLTLLMLGTGLALLHPGPAVHAQAPAPDAAVAAARVDLGARLGADPEGFALLRSAAVIWTDGCLGAAEADEACTEALVEGFVLWLSDGAVAYRYHTDGSGAALRLGQSMVPLSQVPVAPLPEGALPAAALDRFLNLLAAAGFDEIPIQELAVLRDWIPGAFSPHYIVGGATVEIFELPDAAAVDQAINRLSEFGGDADLGDDQALWRYEELLVILLNASQRAEVQSAISDVIGLPLATTSPGEPRPRPSQAALDTSVSAVIDALRAAGVEAVLTDVAVNRPFLPPTTLSAVLRADGASIEIFALVDREAVDEALRKAALPDVAPEAVIWTRGATLILILGDAPAIGEAIGALLGEPAFVGRNAIAPSAPPQANDTDSPGALPATGNGGVADEAGTPDWVWGVIAGVAVAMIAVGGGYRLWLRGRSR